MVVLATAIGLTLYQAINYAGASLKPIGHYALLPSIPADGVRLGRSSDSHLMLWNAATLRRAARLTRDGATWRLTTSIDGGSVDDAHSEPLRLTRRRYRFERGTRWTEVEILDVAQLQIGSADAVQEVVIIPLAAGERRSTSGVAIHVCAPDRLMVSAAGASDPCATSARGASLLSEDDDVEIRTASGVSVRLVRPASDAERLRGLRIRRATGQPEIVIGAAGVRHYIADVDAAVAWVAAYRQAPGIELLTASPAQPSLTARALDVDDSATEIAPLPLRNGSEIQIGQSFFRFAFDRLALKQNDKRRSHVLIEFTRSRSFERGLLYRELLSGTAAPVFYNPLPVVAVPDCASSAHPFLSLGYRDPHKSILANDVGAAPKAAKLMLDRVELPPPAGDTGLTGVEPGEGLALCARNGQYEMTGRDGAGGERAPPADFVVYPGESTPRDPLPQATWTVPPGTTIYFGGQIFETAPLGRPTTAWIVQIFAPLTLMMSAAVLFYQFVTFALAAGGESAEGNAVRQGMLRALVWAPALGVALIVATASIGCWYQLRLATSARLVGKADFLNAFLAYNAIGLAVAAFLAGCMRPTRLDVNRGLQWGLLSIGLGGAALFWGEPLTQWLANASADGAAPAAAAGSLPRLMLPLVAFLLWAMLRWRPGSGDSIGHRIGAIADRITPRLRGFRNEAFRVGVRSFEERIARALMRPGQPRWKQSLFASGWILLYAIAIALLGTFALFLAKTASMFGGTRRLKDLVPVLILWCANWILVNMAQRLQEQHAARSRAAATPGVERTDWIVLGLGLSLAALIASTYVLGWLAYHVATTIILGLALIAAAAGVQLAAPSYGSGALLRASAPFFALLAGSAIGFSEVGTLLIWVPTLSLLMAFIVISSVFGPLGSSRGHLVGAFVVALVFILTPAEGIGLLAIAEANELLDGFEQFDRMRTRFGLVWAPFYYDEGEWLMKVKWLVTDRTTIDAWLQNLPSDVALFGLRQYFPSGFLLALISLSGLTLVAGVGLVTAYLKTIGGGEEGGRWLHACCLYTLLVGAIVLTLWVHIVPGVFDALPLTGVPLPWISHGNVAHVAYTALVVAVTWKGAYTAAPSHA